MHGLCLSLKKIGRLKAKPPANDLDLKMDMDCGLPTNSSEDPIIFAENNQAITRMMKNHLHRSDPVPQKEIDHVFDATVIPGTVSGKLTLVSRDEKSKLTFISDRKNLYCVFIWEGNCGKKSDVASLEFIYGEQSLFVGQEWSASLLIEINR